MAEQATQPHVSIRIIIDDRAFEAPAASMTGSQILELAGLPPTNQLFLEVHGPGDDTPIGPDQSIQLRPGMKFYDVPVGTFG